MGLRLVPLINSEIFIKALKAENFKLQEKIRIQEPYG